MQYKFAVQVGFSVIILGFCLYKLASPSGTQEALYWGGVTGIMAYWMPSPEAGRKERDESNSNQFRG